jgi:hypothetical protein
VEHLCRGKFDRPSKVEWVTNVQMLAHLRFLLLGLQEQDKSRPMLGDPRRCKAGTHAVDEKGSL